MAFEGHSSVLGEFGGATASGCLLRKNQSTSLEITLADRHRCVLRTRIEVIQSNKMGPGKYEAMFKVKIKLKKNR
ncbi:unnamed protein product [Xylocopa violacea]|uniref:Uncharacterized protein n=1 Tax=Xylocopa violacea TaxID=135666 RepID=A0ABP1NUK5_XYLVO